MIENIKRFEYVLGFKFNVQNCIFFKIKKINKDLFKVINRNEYYNRLMLFGI